MQEQVPFFAFRDFVPGVQQQLEQALVHVAQRGNFILGEEVGSFEKEFASYLAEGTTAIGVGNGFDALVISLKALGIGAGAEVIVPSNSYMATVNAVLQVKAKPVLVEPDKYTYNLTAANAEKAITPKTKAILPVHLYGQACQMDELMQLAHKYNLSVVEDCAQAHGAAFKDQLIGTFGDAAAFSFYPTKNLGAMGDGGAIVTSNALVADFAQQYRNYGQKQKYIGELVGVNSRLDELQAAILRIKLQHLHQYNAERQRLANVYLQELNGVGDLLLPQTAESCSHVYHIFNIRTKQRDALQNYLREQGICTAIHYPVPVHLQPAYIFLGYGAGDFPVAEELALTSISLPLFPGLTEQEQERVIKAVREFYQDK
ncbi:DegT/DnrJ/EryC1/StrS family aminotransferase [Pontibacter cellulosilyticus]|uniref:DegT/DnrJ/EryC1/StrS family aminotransferase n=1 Tax=Pontibacter cellulosilyticus TaxID=1720253 RepID=A0A923N981_9BACT|nr:DegT/DnrJ/EryC1/StrS family aminotransferase [Pontibacter cellulosilyticus]MBC5993212.1 DegT/DnrJ/EryC1/StrS family aminotransferase [Pontibacter cellulosilyticus]